MDLLLTFPDTQSVLQAEQVLRRRRIPFETVPQSLYKRKKCGLGILIDAEYRENARLALADSHLTADFANLEKSPTP
jgi:hypothetical protein